MSNYNPNIEEISDGNKRKITKPKTDILPLTDTALKYLTEKRGLHTDTIRTYRLGCDKHGRIVIPFFDEKNELVLVKYRDAEGKMLKAKRKVDDGEWDEYEAKSLIEPGGKGVLFGSHLCDPSEGPLVICYGDYDAMAVAQDGVPNCVTMPFGDAGHDFVKHQWKFLQSFSEIIIYPDNDEYPNPDAEMRARKKRLELARRLGLARVKLVTNEGRFGTKDANELMLLKGKGANRDLIVKADWFPSGIVAVADYQDEPIVSGIPFGLNDVDRITNGAVPGNLILVSGDNEAGKTTNILNFVANFIEDRHGVFFWSGEQTIGEIRYWFERIAAGPNFLKKVIDQKTDFEYFFPIDEVKDEIRGWYRDYFFQLKDVGIDSRQFFEAAELAVRRYGCKVIIADNLMAFTGGEEEYHNAQSDFTQECKLFAGKWNVPFILICHNKKEPETVGGKPWIPDKNSVAGDKRITNWADILLQMYKVKQIYRDDFDSADAVVAIRKCRKLSKHSNVGLFFEPESNRLYQMAHGEKRDREFSWIKKTQWYREEIPYEAVNF